MDHYSENLKSIKDFQEIDIITSKSCTLNCSYCYVHKISDYEWDKEKIMSSIDRVLKSTLDEGKHKGVIIGLFPEPWVNIERSNDLIASVLMLMEEKYPKFFDNHMFSLGTNGVNLHKPIPILQHVKSNLSLAVTVDGIKEQHDMYRVFKDGSGSWDIVTENVKKYQYEYNIFTTKVTLGPDTIKYIYDSALYLWNDLNLSDINMNVVFENLWGSEKEKKHCLEVFDDQLSKLSDYVIQNKLWDRGKYISIIGNRNIPSSTSINTRPFCGAMDMRTIDIDGEVYPCMRFAPFNLDGSDKRFNLNDKTIRRVMKLYNNYDSAPQKCLSCELLSACPMCVGGAYNESKQIYNRTTHHCEFVKLQYKYAKKVDDAIKEQI